MASATHFYCLYIIASTFVAKATAPYYCFALLISLSRYVAPPRNAVLMALPLEATKITLQARV